jgi:endothelin-converting enzyme/putative endopeptidase
MTTKKNNHKNKEKTRKQKTRNPQPCDLEFKPFEKEYSEKNAARINGSQSVEKELIEIFKKRFTPSKIKPNNDYYTYINYTWLKDTEKKVKDENKYYVQVDEFRIVQDKVYNQVIDIVKDYIKNEKTTKSQLISNVYNSMITMNPESRKHHVKKYTEDIDKFMKKDTLWEFLAFVNRNEIISWGCPIYWSLLPDEKNTKYYINTISGPQLTLYDYDLYMSNEGQEPSYIKYKNLVLKKYFQYISDIFYACVPDEADQLNPLHVYEIEQEIINSYVCYNKEVKDTGTHYNPMTASESLNKYDFDWDEFSKHIGYEKTPQKFICNNTNYLKTDTTIKKQQETKTKITKP